MPESSTTTRRTVESAPDLPAIPKLRVAVPQISDMIAVPQSHMGLLCAYGSVEDRSVLVPYLQLRLLAPIESEEDQGTITMGEAFAGTLAFDNVAFLILDLIRGYRQSASRLKIFASGDLKPEPARLMHAKRYLERAREALKFTISHLDDIIEASPAVVEKDFQSKLRPKTKARQKTAPGAKT